MEEFLQREQESVVGRDIVEGYTRIPPATPDEWGDTAQLTDQATVDLLHRLDAEERAGHAAW